MALMSGADVASGVNGADVLCPFRSKVQLDTHGDLTPTLTYTEIVHFFPCSCLLSGSEIHEIKCYTYI